MIKETQKQYRNDIVKVKAFFVTAKENRADQKTANKKSPFRKMVYCFWFFDIIVKGDGMGAKHPPSCTPECVTVKVVAQERPINIKIAYFFASVCTMS